MSVVRRFFQWLRWIVRIALFLILLAFALNNQQVSELHLLFGHQWSAPLALIVLLAFVVGVVVGVLGMLPSWWRRAYPKPVVKASTVEHVQQPADRSSIPALTDQSLVTREF